jgi:hypothetical protein
VCSSDLGGFWKTALAAIVGFLFVGGLIFMLQKLLGPEALSQNPAESAQIAPPGPDSDVHRPSPTGETPKPQPAPAPVEEKKEEKKTEGPPAKAADPEPAPAPPRAPSSSAEKVMTVETEPRGAFIVFDNNPSLSCKSPCTLPLLTGRHSLKASLPEYRDSLKIFEIPQTVFVFLQLEKNIGRLGVTTNPAGATIYINGKPRPEKTPAILNLVPGKYRVSVELSGYSKEEEDDIEVRADGLKNFSIDWGKRQN